MRRRVLAVVIDILAGLAAFVCFALLDSFVHVAADLRRAVVLVALLSASAGLARGAGRPENTWLKGLLIASGAGLPLLALGWEEMNRLILTLLLVIIVLFTILGVHVRHLWPRQSVPKRLFTFLAPLLGLAILGAVTIPTLATRVATRRVSIPAPEFSIKSGDGAVISAVGLRRRVVVLAFWATWCPACRREMPELDELYRRYKGDPRVSFWAVDVLNGGETVEKARAFTAKKGYGLPLAFIAENSSKDLGIDGLPSLVILDKVGSIRLRHNGFDESEPLQSALSNDIEGLLREQ